MTSSPKKAATPKKAPSPDKSASPPKRATNMTASKATTKNTPKTIVKKSTTENASRNRGRPRRTVTETTTTTILPDNPTTSGTSTSKTKHIQFDTQHDEDDDLEAEQRFNQYWDDQGDNEIRCFEWPGAEMTGEPLRGLTQAAEKLLERPFMSTFRSPVPPKSPQQPSKIPSKCNCGLGSCYEGGVCQGSECYPPEVTEEEWLRIIEPAVNAQNVSCGVCRVVLENRIPTVVCLPRRVSVGCTCESLLKEVMDAREKGKQAPKMTQAARKKAVARAKEAITTLYQKQRDTYMTKMEAIHHAELQDAPDAGIRFIVSIFGQGNAGFPPEISKSPTSPKRSNLKSPKSPSKSPLKSPRSLRKTVEESVEKSCVEEEIECRF